MMAEGIIPTCSNQVTVACASYLRAYYHLFFFLVTASSCMVMGMYMVGCRAGNQGSKLGASR
jgi:hypothetical protein